MLLDTHTLIWSMMKPDALSKKAYDALLESDIRCVSAASLYEIALKGSLGKWPEVSDLVVLDLDKKLRDDGFDILPATGSIMHYAGAMDWTHRDPFDRIIVSTAVDGDLALVSKDKSLDSFPYEGFRRLW